MQDWVDLLTKPANFTDGALASEWFLRIADQLLNGTEIVARGQRHRFLEVEVYYTHPEEHPDPFTHKETLQLECGRWYFHRTGGEYRGGSFKGLDLSFGDGTAFAGMLLRGIETAEGEVIDGPSLLVDRLLDATGASGPAELDQQIAGRPAWDPDSPLVLSWEPSLPRRSVLSCARVGLSLKRYKQAANPPKFIMRAYRFLSQPTRTKKGKPHMVLGLHVAGHTAEEIHQQTGSPKRSISKYLEDFETGGQLKDFSAYYGRDLNTTLVCQLYGTWFAQYGNQTT